MIKVIFLLQLIQEGCCQLQVKIYALSTGLPLRSKLAQENSVVGLIVRIDMTTAVDLGAKPQTKQKL